MLWGLLDQSFSSASNFALTFLAARTLHPREFGGFTLAFAAYLIALGVSRACSSEPLTLRYTTAPQREREDAFRSSTGSAILVGVAAGSLMALAAVFAPGPIRRALVGMAPFLPGLLLQDAWRFGFFAAGSGSKATLNDGIWSALLVLFLVPIIITEQQSTTWFAAAWGLSGSAAGLFGTVQARSTPRVRSALQWWRNHGDLVPRYAGEFVASFGTGQAALYCMAGIVGLASVGGLRSAHVLLGPLNVAFMGIVLFAEPEAVRRRSDSAQALRPFCVAISVGLAALSLVWLGLLLHLPGDMGEQLLRQGWRPGRMFAAPAAIALAGSGVVTGAILGLRAIADPIRSFRARIVQSGLILIGASVGSTVAGGVGGAWGLAIGNCIAALAWWSFFVIADAHYRRRITASGSISR